MALSLYNTLSRRVEPFVARDPALVTFYTCGPTVYDDAHIGNFRSFLAADLLRRWIESPLCELKSESGVHRGPRRVRHVMNITDVGHMTEDDRADGGGEDKMALAGQRLLEAKKAGKLPANAQMDPGDPSAIADFYTQRFIEDARALGLKVAIEAEGEPGLMPRASAHVRDSDGRLGMIGVIERLIERQHAYVVGNRGSRVVYFDVTSFAGYGSLSGNTLERLRAGEGGRVSDENQASKRHPADFLLWKEDASHIMKWDSPWGAGYPGWHVECTAMSVAGLVDAQELGGLGERSEALIDLHSGGEDNIFPHHECELAQSACCFNASPSAAGFARMWFHPRFLLVDGDKMSKSKGTFYTVRDLMELGHEPAAIRLELIKTHYRSNANFTMRGLKDSARMVERLRRFAERVRGAAQENGDMHERVREHPVAREIGGALHEDLNIAGALGTLNSWMGATDTPTASDAELLCVLEGVLGLLSLDRPKAVESGIAVFAPGVEASDEIVAKIEARRDAKKAKDFAKADAIRDELAAMGFAIKDVAGGKVEVSRQ